MPSFIKKTVLKMVIQASARAVIICTNEQRLNVVVQTLTPLDLCETVVRVTEGTGYPELSTH